MSIDYIIEKIIHLPKLFRSLGNKSIHELLRDTGYFEIADQINQEDISKVLKQHPECINEWKLFSNDKRASSGWYLKELDNNKHIVGYFGIKKGDTPVVEFSDNNEACAFFIKHEIENIRFI
ncbi:MAG: hypothetical protein ACSLE0_13925 [Chitinophagaceae bacterium]